MFAYKVVTHSEWCDLIRVIFTCSLHVTCSDDDMQSTFSAVSAGQDSITPEDDEEDDEEDEELPVVQSPLSLHG